MLYEVITKSGSTILENWRVKSFKPAKPDKTINKEAAPRITPIAAMIVIKFIALLLLFERVITSYSIHYTKLYEYKTGPS